MALALARFLDAPGDFDLAMLDADLDAVSMAKRMREARPELPLLVCGTYAAGPEDGTALGLSGVRRLEKPVERRSLANALRKLLDASNA